MTAATALARLAFPFGQRGRLGTRHGGGGRHRCDRLAFGARRTRCARRARLAVGRTRTVAAGTVATTGTAGATGLAATPTAFVVGGLLFARLAEDLADAFFFVIAFACHRLRTLRTRQRRQQLRGDRLGRDLLLDIGLDVGQRHRIALAREADRIALGAQARGAADAVHVVLGIERQVEVEHVRHPIDMQAARGHVGGHQQFQLAGLELLQQRLALLLRHVAGQHADAVAGALQRARHALDERLGVDEHHGACALAARQQADQQRDLLLVGRVIQLLPHLGRGDELGLDDELLRLVHVLVGQFQHAVREGGREQQRLPGGALGHAPQQETDVLDEAQVEHAVGFVQHAHLAGVQADHLVLLDVVDQPAGRGDDDVHALLQQFALLVVVHAAIDQGEAQAQVGAELHRVLVDLDGQFARGRQDQRARILGLALGQRRAAQQAVHHRHQERQRLAGAGLRLAGDIAPRQGDRQRHRLDRRAAGETCAFQPGEQRRMQVERGERDVG